MHTRRSASATMRRCNSRSQMQMPDSTDGRCCGRTLNRLHLRKYPFGTVACTPLAVAWGVPWDSDANQFDCFTSRPSTACEAYVVCARAAHTQPYDSRFTRSQLHTHSHCDAMSCARSCVCVCVCVTFSALNSQLLSH